MTSYSYARGGERSTFAGGVILAIFSTLAAILVIAGLVYFAGTGPRHQRALAAAGCEPNLSPDPTNVPCGTVWLLEGEWKKLTGADIQQLNTDVAAYTASEGNNLAAAEAALKAQVTSATAFATSLAAFPFPPDVRPSAAALIKAIDARVKLTTVQEKSTSLAQLRSFNAQIQAASTTIVNDMSIVRKILFTRPTAAQEP